MPLDLSRLKALSNDLKIRSGERAKIVYADDLFETLCKCKAALESENWLRRSEALEKATILINKIKAAHEIKP